MKESRENLKARNLTGCYSKQSMGNGACYRAEQREGRGAGQIQRCIQRKGKFEGPIGCGLPSFGYDGKVVIRDLIKMYLFWHCG